MACIASQKIVLRRSSRRPMSMWRPGRSSASFLFFFQITWPRCGHPGIWGSVRGSGCPRTNNDDRERYRPCGGSSAGFLTTLFLRLSLFSAFSFFFFHAPLISSPSSSLLLSACLAIDSLLQTITSRPISQCRFFLPPSKSSPRFVLHACSAVASSNHPDW